MVKGFYIRENLMFGEKGRTRISEICGFCVACTGGESTETTRRMQTPRWTETPQWTGRLYDVFAAGVGVGGGAELVLGGPGLGFKEGDPLRGRSR